MRVLVNALTAAGTRTGIGHYTAQLLRCLAERAGEAEVVSFPGPWLCRTRAVAAALQGRLARASRPEEPGAGKPGWKARLADGLRRRSQRLLERRFEATCRRGGWDLYHEPNFLPLPCEVPTVATFADLSLLLHPQWHPADRVAHFERRLGPSLAQCRHILAISDFSRQEIIRTLGLDPARVTRTYMGVRAGLGPLPQNTVRRQLRRLGLPEQYLLCLGTVEPRKNVLTLLRAYCALPASVRGRYPLLLVGGWGWGAADVAEYLRREARHRGVRHLGYVSEHWLAALYNGARALAYPSLYEGFGLPPVEMLACGGAVLASTAGAVAETAGSAAHLVEPLDTAGWRDALLRVCTDDGWWSQLRRGAAEAARPFTWERCAADTLDVYRKLTGSSAGRAAA
jgi:alpha-1,3-rhamnosyl/mannosyltransferase